MVNILLLVAHIILFVEEYIYDRYYRDKPIRVYDHLPSLSLPTSMITSSRSMNMEEYMKNTPIPCYDHYGYEARKRRGEVKIPSTIIQSEISLNEQSDKRGKGRRRIGHGPYESTSLPHSFYAVCDL